jgi:hypothetical protein
MGHFLSAISGVSRLLSSLEQSGKCGAKKNIKKYTSCNSLGLKGVNRCFLCLPSRVLFKLFYTHCPWIFVELGRNASTLPWYGTASS